MQRWCRSVPGQGRLYLPDLSLEPGLGKTAGAIGSYRRFSLTYRRRPLAGSRTGTCSGTGLQITIGAACSTAVDGIFSESPVMQDKPAPS